MKTDKQIIDSLTARNLELIMKMDDQLTDINNMLDMMKEMSAMRIGHMTTIENLRKRVTALENSPLAS